MSKFKEINRKKLVDNKPTTSFDPNSTLRIFLMSIIFHVAFPVAHTQRHEHLKEKTFAYSNIFDQTRNTIHATNIKAQQFISNFHQVFVPPTRCRKNTFKYFQDFDLPDIHQQIIPANVVILEAGNKSISNEGIFEACDMFLQDFNLDNNKYMDIVSDEAIFRRTILYLENHAYTRIILGQWHTSKDICSVLITIFSGFDDNVAHQGDRAVKSRKEITWNVINQLIIAFDNLMDNSLFEDISELSNMTAEYTFEGRNRLFNFVIQ
ncbi:hypothetical protein GLOIN_2v1772788 [Rhizophagus irregularis DAOM 181602=DAOM 197198]|uniref:Uncharacterized protein n=1 Tax=Rhizophagus irregularis (strain DAOM 181602 / DAOM 197198 / MUCL 43194) TaxID=747089 RepID=A0A2P4Q6A6_RHIID|nr:hypothetical protein GLOIN_2v1772788 [Rhizophagus irregularis DAOM 181602=DAOM 197198]POG73181.1 hypothetical protein GLOIN_2v1772788 [Rhizophagus irregularis DAOM 181602=DAOM 197198]|eukprot:XP_025180047.1 hypothetical protein GLOIN_2v1772788 [Rhizophagus irregularis DAOM 181602=DAOM 197198]